MLEGTKTRDFFFSIYARRSPTQGLIRPDGEKLLTSDNRQGWTGNVSTYIVAIEVRVIGIRKNQSKNYIPIAFIQHRQQISLP